MKLRPLPLPQLTPSPSSLQLQMKGFEECAIMRHMVHYEKHAAGLDGDGDGDAMVLMFVKQW